MQKQKIKDKRYEHVSFLGCCLVFLLGKNKRRRDTKLRIREVCEAFNVPSFPSLRIMASLRIPTFEEKIPVSYAFCGFYLLGTFLISHYLLYPLYPLLSKLLFSLRRKDTCILCAAIIFC